MEINYAGSKNCKVVSQLIFYLIIESSKFLKPSFPNLLDSKHTKTSFPFNTLFYFVFIISSSKFFYLSIQKTKYNTLLCSSLSELLCYKFINCNPFPLSKVLPFIKQFFFLITLNFIKNFFTNLILHNFNIFLFGTFLFHLKIHLLKKIKKLTI